MVGTKGGSTSWFEDLFGFKESSYLKTQAAFRMEGDVLVCPTSKHPQQVVGPWETPSVAELRARLQTSPEPAGAAAPSSEGGLRFENLPTPTGVVPLILDARNAGAVFQAASQFNCLEMTGPGVSPRQGIAGYALDPTQVMARSLSPLRRTSGDCWWLWCPAFHCARPQASVPCDPARRAPSARSRAPPARCSATTCARADAGRARRRSTAWPAGQLVRRSGGWATRLPQETRARLLWLQEHAADGRCCLPTR